MSLKLRKSDYSAELSSAGVYAKQLMRCMDVSAMRRALMQPRKNVRIYSYGDIVRGACESFFRTKDGMVLVFDGRKWSSIQGLRSESSELSIDFSLIVREAFVNCSGDAIGMEIAKSDWVDREGKIMEYAMKGVMSSPIRNDGSLVGFRNGVWDFSDVSHPVRHSFSERMEVVDLLPYDYDEEAVCPVWQSFLSMMLSSEDIVTLQKFFGLGIVKMRLHGVSIEESLWLIGDGANGKSTILNVLSGVFGSSNISNTSLDSLLDRNTLVRLMSMQSIEGKLFNICTEISGTDIDRGSDVFKSLVSGEAQNVRGIGQNVHIADDIPYFVFSMNAMPSSRRMDDAFRRRLVQIDFRSSVRPEDMDRSLGIHLASEYSGIRNWAMEGYRRLVADGYSIRGRRSSELTNEQVDVMVANGQTVDLWKSFVGIRASHSVGHDDDEVGVWVRKSELFKDYADYCHHRLMVEPASDNQMGRDLHRLHFESSRRSNGMCYKVYCDRNNKFYINNK